MDQFDQKFLFVLIRSGNQLTPTYHRLIRKFCEVIPQNIGALELVLPRSVFELFVAIVEWPDFQQKEHQLGVARPRLILRAGDSNKVYEACSLATMRPRATYLQWVYRQSGKFCPAKKRAKVMITKVHKKVRPYVTKL